MIFSKQKPLIYTRIKERFNVDWEKGLIITYGNTVYCKTDINAFKKVHEQVHVVQQGKMGKDAWWDLYLSDDHFRLLQEIEAYTAEVNAIRTNTDLTTREQRRSYIDHIIESISGPIYGYLITRKEAKKLFDR